MQTKEEYAAKKKLYYLKNKETILRKLALYRSENPTKFKTLQRASELKHREKRLKAQRKRYKANRKFHIKRAKQWKKDNPAKVKTQQKAWWANNKSKHRTYQRKRDAAKRGHGHIQYDDMVIFERDNWQCGICGKKVDNSLPYPNPMSKSLDHIIPLSKNGNDCPANVQLAHLTCNLQKSNNLYIKE